MKNKELEKEMKAMMKELMDYTNKRMAEVEKNLVAYIDKKSAGGDKELKEHAKELMAYSKSVAGDVEKNLIKYIQKIKAANNLK